MYFRQLISYIPFRIIVLAFIAWDNSSYAPSVKTVGFYCDDESIKRPYNGDSIHFIWLLIVSLCIFPLLMYTTELLCRKQKTEGDLPKCQYKKLLRSYLTGSLFVLGVTELLKLSFSELRPHFFTTCLPDMKNIQCSDGLITHFNCTGKGRESILGRDVYKSFPSGHAALSFYSFVFLNIYLSSRMKLTPATLAHRWWSHSIPVITFIWTVMCCISRILDNRHYWWDVLAGIFIGLIGGVWTVRTSLKAALVKQNIPNGLQNKNF